MTSKVVHNWHVYIVECADKTLYTGITKDVEKRLVEHNTDNKLAAKYTRVRRPVELMYQESCTSRSTATKREMAIKCLSRQEKQQLISSQ